MQSSRVWSSGCSDWMLWVRLWAHQQQASRWVSRGLGIGEGLEGWLARSLIVTATPPGIPVGSPTTNGRYQHESLCDYSICKPYNCTHALTESSGNTFLAVDLMFHRLLWKSYMIYSIVWYLYWCTEAMSC